MSKGLCATNKKAFGRTRPPEGSMHLWPHLGLAIPRRVASPQSPNSRFTKQTNYTAGGAHAALRPKTPHRGLDTRAVMGGFVLASSRLRPGFILGPKIAKNTGNTRCSACEEKTWTGNAAIRTGPSPPAPLPERRGEKCFPIANL